MTIDGENQSVDTNGNITARTGCRRSQSLEGNRQSGDGAIRSNKIQPDRIIKRKYSCRKYELIVIENDTYIDTNNFYSHTRQNKNAANKEHAFVLSRAVGPKSYGVGF